MTAAATPGGAAGSAERMAPRAFVPLAGGARLAATLSLALASFMNILDLTIANVSVPTIAGAMGVTPTEGTWIVTSYAVSEAIMLPLTGWLAARFGQLRMFLFATFAFTAASATCALAPDFAALLSARVLQGAVGAAMIPLAQAMLLAIHPPAKRGLAMGIFAMTTVAAPIVGPLTGGWITDHLSWHWIFLVNIPVGALCMATVWSVLGDRESPRTRQPVDAVGLLLLAVGVGSLQIMLDKGNELDWFGSTFIIALACIAAVALATLVAWVLTAAHPIVDLRLFGRRNYAVGVAAFGLASVAFFGVNVVVPLWLQTEMGYTSEWAGRTMAFGGMLAVVLGPLIGANIHRVDARFVAAFGLAVFAAFAFLSASFPPDVDFWTLALTRLIMGVGISSLFVPLMTIYLSGLPPARVPSAAGLANFTRNIGSSFGTSVMVSVWDHRTTQFGAALAEHVTNHNPAATAYLDLLASLGMTREAALAYVRDVVIAPQASFLATTAVLRISGTLMLAMIALVLLARPPFGAPPTRAP